MALRLRTLLTLGQDLGSVLVPTWRLTTIHNPVPRVLSHSCDFLGHQACMCHTDIHTFRQNTQKKS